MTSNFISNLTSAPTPALIGHLWALPDLDWSFGHTEIGYFELELHDIQHRQLSTQLTPDNIISGQGSFNVEDQSKSRVVLKVIISILFPYVGAERTYGKEYPRDTSMELISMKQFGAERNDFGSSKTPSKRLIGNIRENFKSWDFMALKQLNRPIFFRKDRGELRLKAYFTLFFICRFTSQFPILSIIAKLYQCCHGRLFVACRYTVLKKHKAQRTCTVLNLNSPIS